jgi:hypothetical protein
LRLCDSFKVASREEKRREEKKRYIHIRYAHVYTGLAPLSGWHRRGDDALPASLARQLLRGQQQAVIEFPLCGAD